MGYKCLIADDMGLGKTSLALVCFQQSPADRLLVVCPASVKHNWVREVRETLGDVPMVHLIDGTKKKRDKILADILELYDQGGVAIINYDLLPHLNESSSITLRNWAAGGMVALDESHYIKNKEAGRTKWVLEHLALARFRICLTGTPVRNMIDDLYTQADFCRPGMWTSYSDFCRRYLIQIRITVGNRSFFQPKGTKNHAELNKLVNTFQIRRLKKDVLDLPPKIRTVTSLELDQPTRRIYKVMRDLALLDLAQLDQNAPVFQPKAGSATDAALRCEQIAQGFVGGIPDNYLQRVLPLLDGHAERIPGRDKELIFPKSTKLKWTTETIDTILAQGSAPVVFSKYNAPLYWLAGQYQDFGLLTGDDTSKKRDDIIQAFQNGELAGILCQVKISEGFNLTRGTYAIFLGRDWSPAINGQAEERCYRIGTTGTVNILVPVVKETIEEHIDKRLGLKADEAERALRNLTVGELREIL
jgi:SNF2 family DNA or RNA helicase